MSTQRPPVHDRLDGLETTLTKILSQTTATNGKVIRLNEEVFGDVEHQTPGLKMQVDALHQYVADQRAVGRVVKFALPLLGVGSIGTWITLAVKAGIFH